MARGDYTPVSGRELEDPFGVPCPSCGRRSRETSDSLGRGAADCARCGVVPIPRRPPTAAERAAAELEEAEVYRAGTGCWPPGFEASR